MRPVPSKLGRTGSLPLLAVILALSLAWPAELLWGRAASWAETDSELNAGGTDLPPLYARS
jgi:hypothetical protein